MPVPSKDLWILGSGMQSKSCLNENIVLRDRGSPGARNRPPTAWLSVVSAWCPEEERASALMPVTVVSSEGSKNQGGVSGSNRLPSVLSFQ